MTAYARLQEAEFRLEREQGYRAVKQQWFVGTGYFDEVAQVSSLEGKPARWRWPVRPKSNSSLRTRPREPVVGRGGVKSVKESERLHIEVAITQPAPADRPFVHTP